MLPPHCVKHTFNAGIRSVLADLILYKKFIFIIEVGIKFCIAPIFSQQTNISLWVLNFLNFTIYYIIFISVLYTHII